MSGKSVVRLAARWCGAFLLLLVFGGWNAAHAENDAAVVGRVSLAVGDIQRVSADGQRAPLKLGDTLRERDRISTGRDALAMIVFIDQGRLALRPDTEVWIKSYRVDPSGADTQLDLELLRGTVRQISGRAAQLQPERYRLNTPIAAIGVRGTDFLARLVGGQVATYVHEGAIVIQPPAAECPVASRCPVWAFSSAGDAGALLQVQAGGQVRRSYAGADDVERLFGVRLATAVRATSPQSSGVEPAPLVASAAPTSTAAPAPDAVSGAGGATAGVASGSTVRSTGPNAATASTLSALASASPRGALPSALSVAATALGAGNAASSAGAGSVGSGTAGSGANSGANSGGTGNSSSGSTTGTPPLAAISLPTGLAWARPATPYPGNRVDFSLLVPLQDAMNGREGTVGDVGLYNLWRNTGSTEAFASLVGTFSFSLAAANARFLPVVGSELSATVDQARLSVNFDAATFSTALRLSGAGVPVTNLSLAGSVTSKGFLLARSSDSQQSLAGALTLDGREAGYFFNVATAQGSYQGITLWGLPEGAAVPGPVANTTSASPGAAGGVTNPNAAPAIAAGITTLPLPTQLVWGRFSSASAIPLTLPFTLPVSFEQASAGRQPTVGEIGQYGLWRANTAGGLSTSLKGEFTFGLSAAQAFYTPTAGSALVATVNQASLTANFDTTTFATRLLLGGGDVPLTVLEATGRINDEGLFTSRSADGNQVVAGAFTTNAKEAGYLFRLATKGGQFQGITLWGRKP
jgi:hypothetical protein